VAKRKPKKSASKRGKGRVSGTAARKKVAKGLGRKTAAKKVARRAAGKAKSKKRAVRKKTALPPTEARQEQVESVAEITEVTVVDIVEEPRPGIVTVTEFEVIETTVPPEGEEGSGLAEEKDEKP
jgi:hypothetical protein